MDIDTGRFRKIVTTVFGATDLALSKDDATAVLEIAQLAVDVDHHEDPDELELFNSVSREICALAKLATMPKIPTTPWENDEAKQQLRAYGAKLKGKPAGALAYVLAYLLTVADLQLDEAESELADDLRVAIGLDEARADELIAAVSQIVTPPA